MHNRAFKGQAMPRFEENADLEDAKGWGSQTVSNANVGIAYNLVGDIAERSEVTEAIVIIDRRTLSRDCLERSLKASMRGEQILTFSTAEEWLNADQHLSPTSLVLLCIGGQNPQEKEASREIALLSQAPDSPPIILMSDIEGAGQVLSAVKARVRGYITTDVTLEVAVEAMHLVRAGGIYLPATSLLQANGSLAPPPGQGCSVVFSARQRAVLKAVQEGKANKVIAYELNMTESTVKVHLRNIMKKLNAKNRTEVAFKTVGMFGNETAGDPSRY